MNFLPHHYEGFEDFCGGAGWLTGNPEAVTCPECRSLLEAKVTVCSECTAPIVHDECVQYLVEHGVALDETERKLHKNWVKSLLRDRS